MIISDIKFISEYYGEMSDKILILSWIWYISLFYCDDNTAPINFIITLIFLTTYSKLSGISKVKMIINSTLAKFQK